MDVMSPEKSSRDKSAWYVWLTLLTFILFVWVFVIYVRAEKRIDQVNEQRIQSLTLADELRHSSNDLTRMVQLYVVSGDPQFKRHYQEIIEIRDGKKPRPADYHHVYWDLVRADDLRPRPFESAAPLLELMQKAGFTEAEFAKLKEAKTASDRLTRTEYVAMGLVEAKPATPANRLHAIEMLNDTAYRQAKAGIMRPISEFSTMVAERTDKAVAAATEDAYHLRMLPIGAGLLLLALLWRALVVIAREKREHETREAQLQAVFDHAAVGLARLDISGRILNANQEYCRVVGYSNEGISAGAPASEQNTLPDEAEADRIMLERLLRGDAEHYSRIKCYPGKDGNPVWGNIFVQLARDAAGQPQNLIVALIDVTDKIQADEELDRYRQRLLKLIDERTTELGQTSRQLQREITLREQAIAERKSSEAMFRFVAENSVDMVWVMDISSGKFTYVSPSAQRMRGFTPAEIMSQPLDAALTPESAARIKTRINEAMNRWQAGERSNLRHVTEIDQLHRDGHIVHTEAITLLHAEGTDRPTRVLGISRDISERKHSEKTIQSMALYDGLSGLPNRRLLLQRLQQEITYAKHTVQHVALLFVELDKLDLASEGYSRRTAESALHAIAERMTVCLHKTDMVARLGANQFVILLPALPGITDALVVAKKVSAALNQSLQSHEGLALDLSASIGVALYPDHADNPDDLLRFGDEAMRQSRRGGSNRIEIFAAKVPADISTGAFIHLTWKAAYACGNAEIDGEHQDLFQLANRLLEIATLKNTGSEVFNAAFDMLLGHIAAHFRHEEMLLKEQGYAQLAEHAELHRLLIEQATALRRQVSENGVTVEELVDFLAVDVIAKHMLQEDKKFFPLFASLKNPATPQP